MEFAIAAHAAPTESRKQKAESRKQKAESRKQKAESRKQKVMLIRIEASAVAEGRGRGLRRSYPKASGKRK
ncbi:hypothetical protein [Lysobacter sp. Root559]|uniref:hypothetical protein n=1 Tax=Lysobacter sp. Root559 TaxID=1736559 RepID=UPI000AED8358|nr:hypothetical protein [Lysobacter sp. Root559]